jgi:uncharacterized protein (TIGR02118 family)
MIKLVSWFKRKPGLSYEDFVRHWHEVHGPLIAATNAGQYVLRYEQALVVRPANGREPQYDGCTTQWYESVESFWASLAVPDQADILADVANFLDRDTLQWFLLDEPNVVIDRRDT